MRTLSFTVLLALLLGALVLAGCKQPTDIELKPDVADDNLELNAVVLPDSHIAVSSVDSSAVLPYDQVRYDGLFAVAYAHRLSQAFSAGIGGRVRTEEVTDTRYQLVVRDTLTLPSATTMVSKVTSWLVDASLMWHPQAQATVSGAARNLLWWRFGDAGSPVDAYYLPTTLAGELGIAYTLVTRLLLARAMERANLKGEALAEYGVLSRMEGLTSVQQQQVQTRIDALREERH
jgi:hypothetical protein